MPKIVSIFDNVNSLDPDADVIVTFQDAAPQPLHYYLDTCMFSLRRADNPIIPNMFSLISDAFSNNRSVNYSFVTDQTGTKRILGSIIVYSHVNEW